MAGELQGKGAIVTGGASGIGRATVLALAQAGATVAVLDRDEDGVRATVSLVKQSGANAIAVPMDLAKTTELPFSKLKRSKITNPELCMLIP